MSRSRRLRLRQRRGPWRNDRTTDGQHPDHDNGDSRGDELRPVRQLRGIRDVDAVQRPLHAGERHGHDGALSRSALAAASLEGALVDDLLSVHASPFSERIHEPGAPTHPRSLKKALSLVEDHCAEPLTTADVAEAVGVRVRSLQEAFRSHLDTTPMAYLRAVRMSRIHADLRAAGDGTTVTDVALRWGVTHAGRFAQEYRRMYGQPPSQTLRQGV